MGTDDINGPTPSVITGASTFLHARGRDYGAVILRHARKRLSLGPGEVWGGYVFKGWQACVCLSV